MKKKKPCSDCDGLSDALRLVLNALSDVVADKRPLSEAYVLDFAFSIAKKTLGRYDKIRDRYRIAVPSSEPPLKRGEELVAMMAEQRKRAEQHFCSENPSPFATTDIERACIPHLTKEMIRLKMPADFVTHVANAAWHDQGIFNLMEMWLWAGKSERKKIIADLKDLLEDLAIPFKVNR